MTTKNFPLPLMLITALLLLAAPARSMQDAGMQDDELTKLTRALEMLGPVTPEWIMATHPGILTVLDAEKRLYQIKVLGQAPDECTLHAVRNSFYLLKLFTGTRAEFSTVYNQMVNEDSYEKFAEGFTSACSIKKITPEVAAKKVKIGALPDGSNNVIDKITTLEYYGGKNVGGNSTEQLAYFQKIKKIIPKLEPNLNDPLAIAGAAAVSLEIPEMKHFYALAENQNYTFCVNLSVATIYQHATALLVTKQNGVISFIFANSLGSLYADYAQLAINIVIDFANNPERLEDAIIRMHYFSNECPGLKFLAEDMSIKRLKNNTLFKKFYYPAFKALCKEDEEDQDEKKLLEDLDPSKG